MLKRLYQRRGIAPAAKLGAAPFPGSPIDAGGSKAGFAGLQVVPFSGAFASSKGGYIDCYNTSGGNGGGGDDDEPSTTQVSLDVGSWAVRKIFEQAPKICSGQLGATDYRLVGYRYEWRADILWDYRRPADSMGALRSQYGLELVFWLGDVLYLNLLAKQNQNGTGKPPNYPFLWCPDAMLSASETTLDAIRKKMVRVPVQGVARSHFFTCPVEGTPSDDTTVAGAYNTFYQNIGTNT